MTKKIYGWISKEIKNLCGDLCLRNGNELNFKEGLKKLLKEGANHHSIGLSLQKWSTHFCKENVDKAWNLADEVDPKIRKSWIDYRDGPFKDVR